MSIVRDRRLLVFLALLLCIPLCAAQTQSTTVGILPKPYQKWIDEDVRYLITDQERADFDKLATDRQRDKFVEAFWKRRDPCPGSEENEFKAEHYRRLAYANEQFAASVPGWKTDRGRIYVIYGPPDQREQNPGQGDIDLPAGTLDKGQYPSETWHYKFLHSLGRDVSFEFVDTCRCGRYELRNDPTQEWRPPKRKNDREAPRDAYVGQSWENWLAEDVRWIITGKEKKNGTPGKVISNLPWQKWLSEDVLWIIHDNERAEFMGLKTDQQRDDFITSFWERRNPTPGSSENKFKEEHYQRIAYANLHFGTDAEPLGWRTDRGGTYIVYGPPDKVLHNPDWSPNHPEFPQHCLPQSEVWYYESSGNGDTTIFDFVDLCDCGEYFLTRTETLRRLGI